MARDYSDLLEEIAFNVGWGRDPDVWTDDQAATLARIVESGLAQFYYPTLIEKGRPAHSWSFLRPIATLATAAGEATYDLPEDFGGFNGPMTYAAGTSYVYPPVYQTKESEIRRLLQADSHQDRPTICALRPKAQLEDADAVGETEATTSMQLWELLLYPTPDNTYTLYYCYKIIPPALDATTRKYPLGGDQHAETILESCLAIAEQRLNDTAGLHTGLFQQRLLASIELDRAISTPDFMGYNGDNSDGRQALPRPDAALIFTVEGLYST